MRQQYHRSLLATASRGERGGGAEAAMVIAYTREVRFWCLFAVCAAVVGPLVLSPPLWDDYRREQVAGLAIGYTAWLGVGLIVVLALASP